MDVESERQERADACFGLETEWFAVDRDGHAGLMSTAGFGPIPGKVLDHLDAVGEATRAINDVPRRSEVEWLPDSPDAFETWVPWIRRGFFAWDWAVSDYSIIGRPTHPALIDEIHATAISGLARLVRFDLCFNDVRELTLADAQVEWFWPRHPQDRA